MPFGRRPGLGGLVLLVTWEDACPPHRETDRASSPWKPRQLSSPLARLPRCARDRGKRYRLASLPELSRYPEYDPLLPLRQTGALPEYGGYFEGVPEPSH